ncbi:hypothetical protein L7F22_022051 [Adiantum nelumboides]|nr:hypothetical protein [Adiantum nelumboides]
MAGELDSPWALFICGCLSVLALLVLLSDKLRSYWDENKSRFPPGPFAWPFIGHLHLLSTDLPHQALRDLSQKYGPIVGLRLGQQLAVAISSPDLAKEVLHTHDKIFANRPPFQFNELLLSGQNSDIVFSAQCPQAKEDLHSGAVYSQATARAGVRAAGGAVKAAGAGLPYSTIPVHVAILLQQRNGSLTTVQPPAKHQPWPSALQAKRWKPALMSIFALKRPHAPPTLQKHKS